MSETRVVNKHKEPYDVYIGRGSPFGNSHPIGYCSTCQRTHDRADCIAEFSRDFNVLLCDPKYREQLETLRGKRLGCFCKPQSCHGDVIVAWIEAAYRGTK